MAKKICKNQNNIIKKITEYLIHARGKISTKKVASLLALTPVHDEVVSKVCKVCKPDKCTRGKALKKLMKKIEKDLRL